MLDELVLMLSQVDPKVLMVLAGCAIVLFVISIIKRAVKAGIYMLIVAVLLGGGVPVVNSIRDNYGIGYDSASDVLVIRVAGKEQIFNFKDILADDAYKIELVTENNRTKIGVTYRQSNGMTVTTGNTANALAIPNYMMGTVTRFLDSREIRYTHTDITGNVSSGP